MRSLTIRHCFTVALFVIALMGVLQTDALGIQMTIDGIDDAGQYAGQDAYVKFVDTSGATLTPITTAMVPNQWTSSSAVYSYATLHNIPGPWFLQSAGNIWSSDTMVGDLFTAAHAGVYRISPVSGAFTYDSFNWSGVADKWLWQLQIYVVGGNNYTLGSQNLYDSADLALMANLGNYVELTLAEGERLIFWIADGRLGGDPSECNTIDNAGFLKFDITPVPEPSTLMLAGTGLLLMVGRFRKFLARSG